jgi:hypothetical protein
MLRRENVATISNFTSRKEGNRGAKIPNQASKNPPRYNLQRKQSNQIPFPTIQLLA